MMCRCRPASSSADSSASCCARARGSCRSFGRGVQRAYQEEDRLAPPGRWSVRVDHRGQGRRPAARVPGGACAACCDAILRLARHYMQDPESLDFSPQTLSVETIEQHYFTVEPDDKFELLVRLLIRERPKQAIVFCRTKRGTDRLQVRLSKLTKRVECIHGDMPQAARDRVMKQLRSGNLRILVATDVVGRGIDVTGISHIINFDIPQFCDDYVHRVGRTGRMGAEGIAFTFVAPEQGGELTRIEQRINHLLKRDSIRGLDASSRAESLAQDGDEGSEEGTGKENPPPFSRRRPPVRRAL